MKSSLAKGMNGEKLACNFFIEKGFSIIHTNWRYSYYEVDIIASKNKILHFIEVKTRYSKQYGLPEESVDKKKMDNLMQAAKAFIHQHPEWSRIQFDVLSIILMQNENPEFFLLEDVFF